MKYYRRKKREPINLYDFEKHQPCWTCQNACNGGCSWSKEFKPVNGWIATPNKLIGNGEFADTFKIIFCPEYKRDR